MKAWGRVLLILGVILALCLIVSVWIKANKNYHSGFGDIYINERRIPTARTLDTLLKWTQATWVGVTETPLSLWVLSIGWFTAATVWVTRSKDSVSK
jgi:hypothetical protein